MLRIGQGYRSRALKGFSSLHASFERSLAILDSLHDLLLLFRIHRVGPGDRPTKAAALLRDDQTPQRDDSQQEAADLTWVIVG